MAYTAVSEVENVSYIKISGAKNASLWNYFAFKLTDSRTIWNEGRDRKVKKRHNENSRCT